MVRSLVRSLVALLVLVVLPGALSAQSLRPQQKATILADINAQPDLVGKQDTAIAALYNLPASPTFNVYRTSVPVQEINDAITWANFTPADAPDTTQLWLNRATAAQGKQFNLQTLLIGAQGSVNASKPNVRAGIQDATTNLPTGTGGASVSGGWVAIRDNVLARAATRLEKLLATTTVQQDGSTAAKAATLTFEGAITAQTVSDILAGR